MNNSSLILKAAEIFYNHVKRATDWLDDGSSSKYKKAIMYLEGEELEYIEPVILKKIQADELGKRLLGLWSRHDKMKEDPINEINEKKWKKSLETLLSSLEDIYRTMSSQNYPLVEKASHELDQAKKAFLDGYNSEALWKCDLALSDCHMVLSRLAASVYVKSDPTPKPSASLEQ